MKICVNILKELELECKKHSIKKITKSIQVHASLYKLWFTEANIRFDYLEISLMFHDKRDAHLTIYDSYDLEHASTLIQNFKLGNDSNKYSLSNNIEFDFENDFDLVMIINNSLLTIGKVPVCFL